MKNNELVLNIINENQFEKNQIEKENLLIEIIKKQLISNMINENIKSMYEKSGVNISKITKLDQISFIPVNMFKKFDLITCEKEDVVRILNSSATTLGKPSRIYLDRKTSIIQSQALISTLKNFLGIRRRLMLVIDSNEVNSKTAVLSARGAAIRGVSSFASRLTYVCDKKNDDLILNIDRLKEFENKYRDKEILVYGFTYIIWSKFVKTLRQEGITLSLPKMKLLHSGGWKKLTNESVSKKQFTQITAETFGTNEQNIVDFYGMVEQVGVVFIDCECGYKHVPDFADIIIRDIYILEEVKPNELGLIEVISILGSSYPSQAILTEDIGEFIGIDDCKCGRKGKYFKFKTRIEKSETRGCGDTFAERESKR